MFWVRLIFTMFAGGFITSFAEHKLQYNLYQTIAGLFKKKA
jgi:hypothetical protein